jgi:hypothetical protein
MGCISPRRGTRAEDPFRGLRAGPVRSSPFSLSPFPPYHPQRNPNTAEVRTPPSDFEITLNHFLETHVQV